MVAGDTRNAEAILAAFRPSSSCKINGARMPVSIAGCAREHESEAMVGNHRICRSRVRALREQVQLVGCQLLASAPPSNIDILSPRHSEEPRFGV